MGDEEEKKVEETTTSTDVPVEMGTPTDVPVPGVVTAPTVSS